VTAVAIELRCPVGSQRLLGKLLSEGEVVISRNLMELHCRDCTHNLRQIDPTVRRIVHRFDAIGDFVETVVEH